MAVESKYTIWYADETTYSSDDGAPDDAPVDGVLAVNERRVDNRILTHQGHEYYYWNGENWVSGHIASLEKWLHLPPPHLFYAPHLFYGVWTVDSMMKKVIAETVAWR